MKARWRLLDSFLVRVRILRFLRRGHLWSFLRNRTREVLIEKVNIPLRFSWLLKLWVQKRLVLGRRALLKFFPTLRHLDWMFLIMPGVTSPSQKRFFIPKGQKPDEFIRKIQSSGINFAVLRWGHEISSIGPGEDIDLLVARQDAASLLGSLTKLDRGGQPVDVYVVDESTGEVSGRYFEPNLAKQILDQKNLINGIPVPAVQDEFDSLSFHLIFHKKETLEGSGRNPIDLARIKTRLRELSKQSSSLTACLAKGTNSLLERLLTRGYLPPLETINGYARQDDFYRHILEMLGNFDFPKLERDALVFIFREEALNSHRQEELVDMLHKWGLYTIFSHRLSSSETRNLKNQSRGGNWGKGPYMRSGGAPSLVVVCFDSFATFEGADENHLGFKNRSYEIKEQLRRQLNSRRLFWHQSNMVHSPDNAFEAHQVLDSLGSNLQAEMVNQTCRDLRKSFRAPVDKLTPIGFSSKGRTRVFHAERDGESVFLKVFAKGHESKLLNEVTVYEEMSPISKLLLSPLSSGENWLLLPWVEDIKPVLTKAQLVSLVKAKSKEIFDFLDDASNLGFVPIDLTPQNLIVKRDASLLFVDFEFWSRGEVNRIENSPLFRGLDETPIEDSMPAGWQPGLERWDFSWGGLGLKSSRLMKHYHRHL